MATLHRYKRATLLKYKKKGAKTSNSGVERIYHSLQLANLKRAYEATSVSLANLKLAYEATSVSLALYPAFISPLSSRMVCGGMGGSLQFDTGSCPADGWKQ